MTGAETAQLVQRINALWPGANLPAETAREWATLLTPVGFAAATAAVRRLAEEPGRQYAPRVWEIIFACKPKRRELAQPDMCDCGMRDCPCALVGRCERGWIISPNPPELPAGAVEKVGAVSGSRYVYRQPPPEQATARPCPWCRPAAAEVMNVGHWSCPDRKTCSTCREIVARHGGALR